MVMVMTAAWIIPAGWATATRIACMATTRHPAGGTTTHGRKEIPLYQLDQYGPVSVAHGPPLSGTTHSTTGHPQVGGTISPGLPRCGGRDNRGRQICPVSLYLCHPCLAPVSLALGPPGPCLVPGGTTMTCHLQVGGTTMTCHLQVGGTTTHGIPHGGPSGRREICPVTLALGPPGLAGPSPLGPAGRPPTSPRPLLRPDRNPDKFLNVLNLVEH